MRRARWQFDLLTMFVIVTLAAIASWLLRVMTVDEHRVLTNGAAAALIVFGTSLLALGGEFLRWTSLGPARTNVLVGLVLGALVVLLPQLDPGVDSRWVIALASAALIYLGLTFKCGEQRCANSIRSDIPPLSRRETRCVWHVAIAISVISCGVVVLLVRSVDLPKRTVATDEALGVTGFIVGIDLVSSSLRAATDAFISAWPAWVLLAVAHYDARQLPEERRCLETQWRLTRIGASHSAASILLSLNALTAWASAFKTICVGPPTDALVFRQVMYVMPELAVACVAMLGILGLTLLHIGDRRRELVAQCGWMYAVAIAAVMCSLLMMCTATYLLWGTWR